MKWGKIALLAAVFLAGWTGSNVYHSLKDMDRLEHLEYLEQQVNVLEAARKQERAYYEGVIKEQEAMIVDASGIISGYEGEISELKDTIANRDVEISELKTAEVQELIERYPALKRFTVALEDQVADQKQLIFKLEQKDLERVRTINAQRVIITSQAAQIESLKATIADKERLYEKCKKDFSDYRLKPGPTSIWTKLFWTGVGFGGAKLGHSLKLF